MRRANSLNSIGGFGPPPSTPNRQQPVRSSDLGNHRGSSPGNGHRGVVGGARGSTPLTGAGGGGGSLNGSGYYRNSSDGVAGVMGGGAFPGSPSRPGMRPSTQGLPSRAIGTPKTSTSSGVHSSGRTGGMSGGGVGSQYRSGGQTGGNVHRDGDGSSCPPFDCKVLQSGGKSINQALHLCAGAGETQGMRPTMEDAHLALINAGTASDGQPVSIFAVLDGHCGRRAADLGAHFLPEAILSRSSLGTDNAAAFTEAVVNTDKAIFSQMGRNDGGSTLIAAVVHNRMLFVANLGDARAVLYDGISTIAMSVDHKPTDQPEQQRIVRCGSFVHFGRVGACLAVSRALGDFEFKFTGQRYGTEREFAVGHVPDIRQINLTDTSKFLLLACDGLWDVCSNEEATAFINSFMASADTRDMAKTLNLCSSQLAMHAVERGSMDNVTCMIIWFHAPGSTTGATSNGVGSSSTAGGGASSNGRDTKSPGASTGTAGGYGSSPSSYATSPTASSSGVVSRVGSRPSTQGTPGHRASSGVLGASRSGTSGSSGYNTRLPSLGGVSGINRRGNL